jgi:hypothetical protein
MTVNKYTMTKVLMNVNLLEYQQAMKDGLHQVIKRNFVGGVRRPERVEGMEPALSLRGVLPPPFIALIFLDEYNGQDPEKDYIAAEVYHDFGIASMNITIRDLQGNQIESGEMMPFLNNPQHLDYLPTVHVPLGTKVIVHVTATDCMGGVGRAWQRRTLGEDDW